MEPVPANAGLYLPGDGYLEFLQEITTRRESLLIFDEVMTGFRLVLKGAQGRFGITPDLSCFGKVIGGGLPVGAFGGRSEIMDCLAPDGPVYQAGTLSGNPLAMAAGISVLEALSDDSVYDKIEALGKVLSDGLAWAAEAAGSTGTPRPQPPAGLPWGRAWGAAPRASAGTCGPPRGAHARRFRRLFAPFMRRILPPRYS